MATVEQVTYNSPDGATMGASATEKISFYGSTPIVQPADVTDASTFLVTTAVTTSCAGFTTAAQLSTFVAQVSSVVAALKNLGLLA